VDLRRAFGPDGICVACFVSRKTGPFPFIDIKGDHMLSAAIGLFVLALVAAFLGFGGIAGTAAGLAKIAFFVFLVLAILSFFFGRRPVA